MNPPRAGFLHYAPPYSTAHEAVFSFQGTRMKLIHWRKLITEAATSPGDRLTDLALHMRDCERAKAILFAKGYGKPGITVAQLAALVPDAPKH